MIKINAVLQASPLKTKKWRMVFHRKKELLEYTDFGAKGMSDFTLHQDEPRRQRFLNRFQKLIKANENDPSSAMTLSHLILWNKPTLDASFQDYLKRFKMTGAIEITTPHNDGSNI